MSRLAQQQADLVRALVAGAPPPSGVDAQRVAVSARALLHKRAREVAHHWPLLMHDRDTRARFLAWAEGRPKTSSSADGFAFAADLEAAGALPPLAVDELARHRGRRGRWRRR